MKRIASVFSLVTVVLFFQNCGSSFTSELPESLSTSSLSVSSTPTGTAPTPIASPGSISIINLHQMNFGAGLMRYTATVQVGNAAPFEAIIDTGSIGLKVMPGVLSSSDYDDTGQTSTSVLGGTRIYKTTVGLASVTVDGVKTSSKIPISVVTSTSCAASAPNCDTGLPGGLVGLLGIGLRGSLTPNPLVELGAVGWVLEGGQPGQSGKISLYTKSVSTSGYFMMQLPSEVSANPNITGLWDDRQLSSCVINNDAGESTCGPTLLDTGGNANFHLSGTSGVKPWADGTNATFRLKDVLGNVRDFNFVIGANPGMDVTLPTTSGTSTVANPINSGQLVFYESAVLYDPVNGIIGVK